MDELQTYMHVRLATEDDAESILEITREAFKKYVELAELDTITALTETKENVSM